MDKTLQEIYDGFADTYEANRGAFDISPILDAFYARLGTHGGALLDLGCGAGEPVARYFIDNGWTVTGVDFSSRMLEHAGKYAPEMTTLHGDVRAVDFAPESFDAVTATYSLFHLPAEDHGALFNKVRDWLKPGGGFLFTYATREYTGSDSFSGYKQFLDTPLYYSHKTPDGLQADLKSADLAVEALNYHDIGGETFLWVTVKKPF